MVVFVAVFTLGRDRPRRRELRRHAHRLLRAPRLPPRAARPPIRPASSSARCRASGCRSCPSALALWVINFVDRRVRQLLQRPRRGRASTRRRSRSRRSSRSSCSPSEPPGRRSPTRSRTTAQARRAYAFVLTYLLTVRLLALARARRARAVARRLADERSAISARRRASRCSPSPSPSTRATRCSRSGAGGRGERR